MCFYVIIMISMVWQVNLVLLAYIPVKDGLLEVPGSLLLVSTFLMD